MDCRTYKSSYKQWILPRGYTLYKEVRIAYKWLICEEIKLGVFIKKKISWKLNAAVDDLRLGPIWDSPPKSTKLSGRNCFTTSNLCWTPLYCLNYTCWQAWSFITLDKICPKTRLTLLFIWMTQGKTSSFIFFVNSCDNTMNKTLKFPLCVLLRVFE